MRSECLFCAIVPLALVKMPLGASFGVTDTPRHRRQGQSAAQIGLHPSSPDWIVRALSRASRALSDGRS